MQQLLRTTLFSVFALILAAGMAAAPTLAQDSSTPTVTVDIEQGDNIEDGLKALDDELASSSGGAGDLVIIGDDYTGEGRVDLTNDPTTGGTLSNITDLTILPQEDSDDGTQEVTIQALTYDGSSGNLENVTVDRVNGGYVRITDAAGDPALNFESSSNVSSAGFEIVDSGGLRIADGATVVRGGNTSFASGSASIDYLGSGIPNLTYNTAGEAVTATAEFPSSAEITTLTLDGNGSVTFESGTTVGTITSSAAGNGVLDASLTVSSGNLTVQNTGVDFNQAGQSLAVSSGNLDVQGGGLTVNDESNVADQSVTADGSLSLNGGLTVGAGQSSTVDVSVGGDLTVPSGGVTTSGSNAEVSVGGAADVTGSVDATGIVDVAGDVSVTEPSGGSDNVSVSGELAAGVLTIDTSTDNALDVSGGTVTASATNINGTANTIGVGGDANVTLGDVTFAEPNPQFDLSGSSGKVTAGAISGDFQSNGGNDTFTLVTGGGTFNPSSVSLNALDDGSTTDGSTVTYTIGVTANESDSDFTLGTVSASSVTDSDDNTTFETVVDLTASSSGSISASGDEFNAITTASGTSIITINGSSSTTFAGAVDNSGELTVNTSSTFDGSITNGGTLTAAASATLNGSLTNSGTFNADGGATYDLSAGDLNNLTGTISIADGQTFTVDASSSGGTIFSNQSDGISGNGTLDVTGGGDVTVSTTDGSGSSGGLSFPTTTHSGSGTLTFEVDDANGTNTLTAPISFSGGVTADGPVAFTTPNNDEIQSIDITGDLGANASIDFGATYDSGQSSSVTLANLTATSGSVDFSSASSFQGARIEGNLTLQNQGTVNVGAETITLLQNFDRQDAPDTGLNGSGGTIRLDGSNSSTSFDPGDALLTFDGTIEVSKDEAQPATVTFENTVRLDNGGLTLNEPGNSLAETKVNLNDNILLRGADFTVGRAGDGTITIDTGANQLIFRGSGGSIDTGGSFEIDRVTSRASGGSGAVTIATGTDLTVTDQLRAQTSGFTVADDAGTDLSPGSGATVVRSFPNDPTDTEIDASNAGTFNDDGNTYGLEFRGSGQGVTASELDASLVQNLSLVGSVTVGLSKSFNLQGTLTVNSGTQLADDDSDNARMLTLSAGNANHTVAGTIGGSSADLDGDGNAGTQNEVTVQFDGGSTLAGSSADNDAATLENVTANAAGVELTNVKAYTGDVTVNSDLGSGESPSLTMSGSVTPTISGGLTVNNGLTLGTDVDVEGAVNVNAANSDQNGAITFNGDLALTSGNSFSGESGASYDGENELRFEDDGTVQGFATGGEAVPNVVVFDDGGGNGIQLSGDAAVSSSLDVQASADLNNNDLEFAGSVALSADITDGSSNANGVFRATGGSTLTLNADRSVPNFGVDAGGETVSVERANSDNAARTLTVNQGEFTLSAGTVRHADNSISVASDFTVASSFDPSTGGIEATDGFLTLDGVGVDLSSDVSVDRLETSTGSADFTSGSDGTLTIADEAELAQTLDASAADNGAVEIGGGATIVRTAANDAFGEVPSFAGDVSIEYDGTSVDFASGREVPSASGNGTIVDVTVNANTVTFQDVSTGNGDVATGNVVVTSTFDLMEGSVTQGSDVGDVNNDGNSDGRRIEIDGGTFAQKNGTLSGSATIAASNYTLRYYPDGGNVTTSDQEFRSSVSTLEFIDGPVQSASSDNLTLHEDRAVGSVNVNRADGSSQLDLNGNTLTASANVELSDGEVADGSGGGLLEVNGTAGDLDNSSDLLVEDALSADADVSGKTTVRNGGAVSGALDTQGTLAVTTENGDISSAGVTFNGSGTQGLSLTADETVGTLTLNQQSSSDAVPKVMLSGGELTVGDGGSSELSLQNGLLVSDSDEVVNLTDSGFNRDVASGDESHIVAAVKRDVTGPSSGDNAGEVGRVEYPIGSENPSYRRFRFDFGGNDIAADNITVEPVASAAEGTTGLPFTDGTGVTISADKPGFHWIVSADQDLSLTADFEVAARTDDGDLTFGSDRPVTDHRIISRSVSDNPSNAEWGLVGDGSGYSNSGPVNGVANIRTTSPTGGVTELGSVFSVGIPAGPAPMIATNEGLTVTAGNTAPLTDLLVAQDEDDGASDLTYTVTTAPTNGTLQDGSGNEINTFTQADIDNGNVIYAASSSGSDSFDFELSDADGNTVTGTFDITVEVGALSISGTVTYPTEGTDALGSGSGIGGVTVEASAGGSVAGSATTNSDGTFTITGLDPETQYDVSAGISQEVTSSDVNSNDAFRVVRGFAGTDPFVASFQESVSDVNGDDAANSTDALQIAQFGLGRTTADPEIPDDSEVGSWFSTTVSVDLGNSDKTGVTVRAAKYGDAELNAGPGSGGTAASLASASTTSESASDMRSVQAGETFDVPVRVSGTDEVGAYSLTLDYAADKASFEGIASDNGAMANASSEDGTVRLGWFDGSGGDNPIRVSGSESALVTLRFKAARGVEGRFTPEVTGGELTAPDASTISGVQVSAEGVRLGVTPDEFALQGSAPNPIKEASQTKILMDLPKQSTVTVEVFNVLGQRVARVQKNLSAGAGQSIRVDGADLSSGQYFYRVSAEMDGETVRKTGRMTVVK